MDVEELLKEMSLQEKIFQLEQFNSVLLKPLEGWDATGPMKDLGVTERDLKDTGSLLNSMEAKRMKDIQKDFLAKNENKIPLAFMHDVIHGYRTIYPINLGLACRGGCRSYARCIRFYTIPLCKEKCTHLFYDSTPFRRFYMKKGRHQYFLNEIQKVGNFLLQLIGN